MIHGIFNDYSGVNPEMTALAIELKKRRSNKGA